MGLTVRLWQQPLHGLAEKFLSLLRVSVVLCSFLPVGLGTEEGLSGFFAVDAVVLRRDVQKT